MVIVTLKGFAMHPHQAVSSYSPKLATHCKRPQLEAPMVVAQFIDAGITLAKWYGCNKCMLLQELYLKRTFDELLHNIADPLVHQALRQQCQDQLYKPLLALKRYYKSIPHGRSRFLKIEHEARVISHILTPYS